MGWLSEAWPAAWCRRSDLAPALPRLPDNKRPGAKRRPAGTHYSSKHSCGRPMEDRLELADNLIQQDQKAWSTRRDGRQYLVMSDLARPVVVGKVRDAAHAQNPQTDLSRHDHLGSRRHPDRVRPDQPEEASLGWCLVRGAANHSVD